MGSPISKLTIKGFKSIRALEGFELKALNVLIGANGAGKSNFVSFFSFLRALVRQELQWAVAKRGGADAHFYLGPKITNEVVGQVQFGRNGYEFVLEATADNKMVFRDERIRFEGRYAVDRTIGKGHAESVLKDHLHDSRNERIVSYVYDAVSGWTVYHFHDTSDTAPMRRKGTTRDYEALLPNAANLAAFLLRLRDQHTTTYRLIRDTIRLVAPFFDEFKLRPEPNGSGDTEVLLEWTQRGSHYPFHPSQLSDGTLRFICLATALLQPQPPAIILLDEPELGLHPYALCVFADLLKQAADRTQVIVSTQSAPLLDSFEAGDVVVVNREEGASVFERLNAESLSEWLDQYSLGELWQKNVFEGGPAHE